MAAPVVTNPNTGQPQTPGSTYVSTDPTGGTPITNWQYGPKATPTQAVPGVLDPTAANWRVGQPVPPGYETYHPNDNPAVLAIRPVAGGAPAAPGAAGGAAGGGKYTGDPSNAAAFLQWLATQPGHDPILDTPGGQQYYAQKIAETGGLTAANVAYWQNKGTVAAYGGAVGAGGGGALGALGTPWWYQTLPTADQAANYPGIQFAEDQARQQIEKGAAAQGTLNGGGTLKDLAAFTTGTALQGYYNLANLQNTYNQSNYDDAYRLLTAGQTASSVTPSPV